MFINFRERESKEKRVNERNSVVKEKHLLVASHMCPEWGSNPQPFGVQDNTQSTEPPSQGCRQLLIVKS